MKLNMMIKGNDTKGGPGGSCLTPSTYYGPISKTVQMPTLNHTYMYS